MISKKISILSVALVLSAGAFPAISHVKATSKENSTVAYKDVDSTHWELVKVNGGDAVSVKKQSKATNNTPAKETPSQENQQSATTTQNNQPQAQQASSQQSVQAQVQQQPQQQQQPAQQTPVQQPTQQTQESASTTAQVPTTQSTTMKVTFYDPAVLGASTMPGGTYSGVAANLSRFPKGTTLKITLPDGQVLIRTVNDTGTFASMAGGSNQLDIAMPNSQIPSYGTGMATVQVL